MTVRAGRSVGVVQIAPAFPFARAGNFLVRSDVIPTEGRVRAKAQKREKGKMQHG